MNLWKEFQALLPRDPVTYGEVLSHTPEGTSRVQLPSGAVVIADGTPVAPGGHAWMQSGRVQGEAPDLPVYAVDV